MVWPIITYYRWHTVNTAQWPALTCAGGRGGAVVLHEDLAVPDVLAVLQLVAGDVDHQPVQPLGSLRVLPAGRVGVHHGQRVHLQTVGLFQLGMDAPIPF